MQYEQPVSTVLVFIPPQRTSKTHSASAQAHTDRTASVIPCEQLVFPKPNERETTASNHLLSYRECTSSSRPTWYIWCQFHLSINFSLEAFVQKNAKFSPKALTKNDLCLRFPLSCGFAELVEHNTPDPPPNNNSKQYNRQQFARAPSRD